MKKPPITGDSFKSFRRDYSESLHPTTDQEQALCRVCSKPLDSSLHIKCLAIERNTANADPALEAEFEKVFGKGGVR